MQVVYIQGKSSKVNRCQNCRLHAVAQACGCFASFIGRFVIDILLQPYSASCSCCFSSIILWLFWHDKFLGFACRNIIEISSIYNLQLSWCNVVTCYTWGWKSLILHDSLGICHKVVGNGLCLFVLWSNITCLVLLRHSLGLNSANSVLNGVLDLAVCFYLYKNTALFVS